MEEVLLVYGVSIDNICPATMYQMEKETFARKHGDVFGFAVTGFDADVQRSCFVQTDENGKPLGSFKFWDNGFRDYGVPCVYIGFHLVMVRS
jgi:hypothetical protein